MQRNSTHRGSACTIRFLPIPRPAVGRGQAEIPICISACYPGGYRSLVGWSRLPFVLRRELGIRQQVAAVDMLLGQRRGGGGVLGCGLRRLSGRGGESLAAKVGADKAKAAATASVWQWCIGEHIVMHGAILLRSRDGTQNGAAMQPVSFRNVARFEQCAHVRVTLSLRNRKRAIQHTCIQKRLRAWSSFAKGGNCALWQYAFWAATSNSGAVVTVAPDAGKIAPEAFGTAISGSGN